MAHPLRTLLSASAPFLPSGCWSPASRERKGATHWFKDFINTIDFFFKMPFLPNVAAHTLVPALPSGIGRWIFILLSSWPNLHTEFQASYPAPNPTPPREEARDRVSLCNLGCSGAHSVGQTGLKINSSASASWVLGLQACATTAWCVYSFILFDFILFMYFFLDKQLCNPV